VHKLVGRHALHNLPERRGFNVGVAPAEQLLPPQDGAAARRIKVLVRRQVAPGCNQRRRQLRAKCRLESEIQKFQSQKSGSKIRQIGRINATKIRANYNHTISKLPPSSCSRPGSLESRGSIRAAVKSYQIKSAAASLSTEMQRLHANSNRIHNATSMRSHSYRVNASPPSPCGRAAGGRPLLYQPLRGTRGQKSRKLIFTGFYWAEPNEIHLSRTKFTRTKRNSLEPNEIRSNQTKFARNQTKFTRIKRNSL